MERKLGEIFTYNGKTYKVVPNSISSCEGCAFKASCFCSADYNIVGECFKYLRNDKTRIIFKEVKKHMDIKNNQLIIEIPEGMEIDIENSDLSKGIIKFKKDNITLEDIYDNQGKDTFVTNVVNNNRSTYDKIAAIATLMDIANYYNKDWKPDWNNNEELKYYIVFDHYYNIYRVKDRAKMSGNIIYFAHEEDAQAVIDNPNFKDILNAVYKN